MEEKVQTAQQTVQKKSGLATAGLVLGIIGVGLSLIPLINTFSFVLGVLALVFGAIPCAKKVSVGKAIAALVLGILAVVMTIVVKNATVKAIDQAVDDFNSSLSDMTGENTDALLGSKVTVDLGEFTVKNNGYFEESTLPVTVTNIDSEPRSFSVQIEAVTADGERIDSDYVYANSLNAGQKQVFDTFTLVADDTRAQLKSATFKIVEVSMY